MASLPYPRTLPGGAAVSAAPTEQPLHLPTEFTEFSCRGELLCILRVPWDNTTQPKHLCVLCIPWENTITAGGVGMAGMPYPPKCVLWAVHLCLVGAAETAAPPERTSVSICEICGRTPRTLTFRACVPWENTHCLLVYPSLVYLKINDYGYVPGWCLQPKPIVLARHPSSRRGRPASHP